MKYGRLFLKSMLDCLNRVRHVSILFFLLIELPLLACKVPSECRTGDSSCMDRFVLAFLEADPLDPCKQDILTLIQPGNWGNLKHTLEQQASLGSYAAPSQGSMAYTNVSGGDYYGGVLGSNGKVYGIPTGAAAVMEIDPETNTRSSFGSFASTFMWAGGVLAPNGKIYGTPNQEVSFLLIDPVTRTTSTFGTAAANDYFGGVLAPNGKIYVIPHTSTSVAVIDPANNMVATFGSFAGATKWVGGVLAPNGKIYAIPYTVSTVLVIDPSNNSAYTIPSATGFLGGVLAPNGKIYARNATSLLIIDPETDTATTVSALAAPGFTGGVYAPNGTMFFAGNAGASVFGTAEPGTNITANFGSVTSSLRGAVLAPNGKIYGMPYGEASIPVIDTGSRGKLCQAIASSAYFNKL
ncbi:MAG: hypothetical protein K8S54_07125 [Spirochaetia bacterium]|nr:hypothetical protein [Spirochaetia bacterium]